MKTVFTEDYISRLAISLRTSYIHSYAAQTVTQHFRSMHYMSSMLVCDAIVLNLALNDDIAPDSADEIITCIRRMNKSLYTTVDSAFFPVKDKFELYAKTVLGEQYDNIKNLNMRTTNYLVYVMSHDIKNRVEISRPKIFHGIIGYDELIKNGLPHYD